MVADRHSGAGADRGAALGDLRASWAERAEGEMKLTDRPSPRTAACEKHPTPLTALAYRLEQENQAMREALSVVYNYCHAPHWDGGRKQIVLEKITNVLAEIGQP